MIYILILIFSLFSSVAFAHENGLADTYTHVAKGCTTVEYLDDDCDGYGNGNGTLGPDPDDNDAAVYDSATAISKYTTMEAFIKAKTAAYSGISNGGISRFIVVDMVNGNNTTGVKSATLATALASPFQSRSMTWHGAYDVAHQYIAGDGVSYGGSNYICIKGSSNGYNVGNLPTDTNYWTILNGGTSDTGYDSTSTSAGDCFVYRGPSYNFVVSGGTELGTATNPIYFMPYPGEAVTLASDSNIFAFGDGTYNGRAKYITADGMGGGFYLHSNIREAHNVINLLYGENVTIREIRGTHGGGSYPWAAIETVNHKAIKNVFLDNVSNHTLYWMAHADTLGTPHHSKQVGGVIKGNIFKTGEGGGYPVIQLNGGADDLTIEENIFHSYSSNPAIAIVNGLNVGVVRNNISFNGPIFLHMYWYRTSDPRYNIACYGATDLTVANNTVFMPSTRYGGTSNDWPMIKYSRAKMVLDADQVWQPNTSYDGIAYVKPSVANGCVYGLHSPSSGGLSGGTEPTWPTDIGGYVTDNNIQWYAFCDAIPVTGHIYRNNIFYMAGTGFDHVFQFHRVFPDASTAVPTIQYNNIYRANVPTTKTRTMQNCGTDHGEDCDQSGNWDYYTFEEFQAFDANIANNIWANPIFTWTEPTNDWAQSGAFNLSVSEDSLTINAGTFTGLPPTDIRGNLRSAADIGAYAYLGSSYYPFFGISSQGATFR